MPPRGPWLGPILSISLLLAGVATAQETAMVPVVVDGERVRLEMRIYRPTTTDAPAPTLVFNHGSTGGAPTLPSSRVPSTSRLWHSSSSSAAGPS